MERPRFLFVAPITPAVSGNGLAMRAGLLLDALSDVADVSLLIAPVAGPAPAEWPPFVVARTGARVCLHRAPRRPADGDGADAARDAAAIPLERRLLPALSQLVPDDGVEIAGMALADRAPFDVLVCMRLYLAPLVAAIGGAQRVRPRTILDLDDDEVTTRHRLARMHEMRGDAALADAERIEADKYRLVEERWARRFDRMFVSAACDRAVVSNRTGHPSVEVAPNGVTAPSAMVARPRTGESARLLFVGTLGYPPNIDAASLLCRDVLPRLRRELSRSVCVDLVGAHPNPRVRELATLDGVELHADVVDVAPFYQTADIAVVPLRAGGGTRVKILEAMAHGVPVVTTAMGAEGLDVAPGEHVLFAEDPAAMANACRQLIDVPELGARLRDQARRLVLERYERSIVARRIQALVLDAAVPADAGTSARVGG